MVKKLARAAIILGLLFVLTGCDWLQSFFDSFNPKPPATGQVFENTVGPNGTVYNSNDGFYLEIPPGALATATQITVEYTTEAEVGQILQNGEITGRYLGGFKATPEHLQFDKPVTIRFPVSALSSADGVPFHASVDTTAQSCQVLPGEISYDSQNKIIELKISSFSIHSVMEVKAKTQINAILAQGTENMTEGQLNTIELLLEGWFYYISDRIDKATTLDDVTSAIDELIAWQKSIDLLEPLDTSGWLDDLKNFETSARSRIVAHLHTIQDKAECACSKGTDSAGNGEILAQVQRMCETLDWSELGSFIVLQEDLFLTCGTVKIDPESATVDEGKSRDLVLKIVNAKGGDMPASNTTGTWESSDTAVAGITGNGTSATVSGVKEGTATITVSVVVASTGCEIPAEVTKTATASITVKKPGTIMKVVSVSPATGSINVAVTTPLVVTFDADPDPLVTGSIVIGSNTLTNDGVNCQMSITDKVLTVVLKNDWIYNKTYTGISITGFKNIEGADAEDYADTQYNFTTVNPVLAISWTWDSYSDYGHEFSGTESYTYGNSATISEPSAYAGSTYTECLAYNNAGKYFDLSLYDTKKGSNLHGWATWLFYAGSYVSTTSPSDILINCTHYEAVGGIITGNFTAYYLEWNQDASIYYEAQGTFIVRHIATDVW